MQPVKFIGVARHRLTVDGEGVTTLAAFWGCPLKCAYCLNPQCNRAEAYLVMHTPQSLYDYVKIDQLYFLATGGGVTFGGGEPLLNVEFIRSFRELCGPHWNLTLETSLNVPNALFEKSLDVVDHYIVDVKDMNEAIYKAYTGQDAGQMLSNLRRLADLGLQERVVVRLPLIEQYNTEADVEKSAEQLTAMGFTHLDRFKYKTDIEK